MLLESRFNCGLDLLDISHSFLDFRPCIGVQQCDARTGACRVACAGDFLQRAVGDHPQNHRVFRGNMRAKGASQNHAINGVHADLVHQQTGAGVKRCLGHLDSADIRVGDRNPWSTFGAAIPKEIGICAPLGYATR